MADRSSVLQGLKSSPKGQLCYDEKMKKERIWTGISCIRVQRVVEEHYSRVGEVGAAGVPAARPGALDPGSRDTREDGREERETDLASDLLGLSSTSVTEQERRSSKDGEEATHGCSPSLCRVQPEAFYHPREVAMEQEYIRCESDVWWREEMRKQSEITRRVEVMSEHKKQLEEDRCRELLEAVQCSRERERESRTWKQQLEEKLWVEGQSEIDARLKVYRQQQLYADVSLKTMEEEKRELYSRLWSELYSLLQTHLKAREVAVQVCRDITRLVSMKAKVDHLADSLLKRVKDARGNLTEDMHQTLLREVHVFDGAVQELMREVVSVNIQVGKEEEGRRAAAEEQRRRQEEERERRRKEAEKPTAQHTQQPQPATPPSSVVSGSAASTGTAANPSVLSEYNRLIERRKNVEKAAEVFVDTQDPDLKAYRFDLQKAVNTPINSISIQSASHIKDKVQRLCSLLAGRPVEVVGKRVSVTTHPQALNYCRILLAKKIVGQGEKQVSSHFEAAFPTAAVALGVWSEHLDIGDLLMASFYLTCPVLVPLPIPTPPQVTEGEYKRWGDTHTHIHTHAHTHTANGGQGQCQRYYLIMMTYLALPLAPPLRLLGYNVSGKVLEDDDKYMKRMSGVVRLFAAMVQCPTVIWGRRNPIRVEHGWRWFALMLNMAPLPGITATAIFDFLEVAGHALMNAYGAQFRKLLRVLVSRYLPKIEAVSPPSHQGPIIRLKQFLESCIQTGSVPTPKGMLPFEFWKGR